MENLNMSFKSLMCRYLHSLQGGFYKKNEKQKI